MRAKKSLGQNFLRDDGVIGRIVASLDLRDDETVIEIGPGRGALTDRLLDTGANVIAFELDRDFVPVLRTQFHFQNNFSVVEADVLYVDFAEHLGYSEPDKTKLVGNLPYNISTPILQRLIEQRALFDSVVLMFQREVVERITATPGGKSRGFLSVLVEDAFVSETLFDVPPTAFQPVPKVWSSVVRLKPRLSTVVNQTLFRKIVSTGFAQKRKTLLNNLKTVYADSASLLAAANIDGRRRAETLSLAEWITLAATIEMNQEVYQAS